MYMIGLAFFLIGAAIAAGFIVLGWKMACKAQEPVSYTHLDVYKRQGTAHIKNCVLICELMCCRKE